MASTGRAGAGAPSRTGPVPSSTLPRPACAGRRSEARAKRSAGLRSASDRIRRRPSGGRLGAATVAALRHEGVELLAVLRPLQLLDELGEVLRLLLEPAPLLLEPLELAAAILLEGEVAGRGEVRAWPEAAVAPVRPGGQAGEVLVEELLRLLRDRIAHELPDQVGERQRPGEDEAEHDPGDLQPLARRAAAALVITGVPAGGRGMARHRDLRM